jgi:hypothetical protein
MKRLTTVLALALALIALPAAAQKVFVDYDESVDFTALKTFTWSDTGTPSLESTNFLLHRYIKDQIIAQLETAGLAHVESDADFLITYRASPNGEIRADATGWGYKYGNLWIWSDYGYRGPVINETRTYKSGTLVIDAWDSDTETLMWRGTATASTTLDPDKARKRVDKSIRKIVKKWDETLRK